MKKERDVAAALSQSPFRRGTTLTQQIEIANLQAVRSMEERRSLDIDYATALVAIQTEIDTRMDLARLWGLKDRNDPLFIKIQEFMQQKQTLTSQFQEKKGRCR